MLCCGSYGLYAYILGKKGLVQGLAFSSKARKKLFDFRRDFILGRFHILPRGPHYSLSCCRKFLVLYYARWCCYICESSKSLYRPEWDYYLRSSLFGTRCFPLHLVGPVRTRNTPQLCRVVDQQMAELHRGIMLQGKEH